MSDSARQVSGQAPAKKGLSQKRALVIIASFGIEEPELTRPVEDLRAAGVQVTVAGATPIRRTAWSTTSMRAFTTRLIADSRTWTPATSTSL